MVLFFSGFSQGAKWLGGGDRKCEVGKRIDCMPGSQFQHVPLHGYIISQAANLLCKFICKYFLHLSIP